jgi:hypothetical protein
MTTVSTRKIQENIRSIIRSMPPRQKQRFYKKMDAFFIDVLGEEDFLKEIGKNTDEEYAKKDSKSNKKNIDKLFNLNEQTDHLIMEVEKINGIYDINNWLIYQI